MHSHTRTHAHPRASDTQRIEITEKLIPSHFPLYLSPTLSPFPFFLCGLLVGGIGRHKSIVRWFHSLSCIQWRWGRCGVFYLFCSTQSEVMAIHYSIASSIFVARWEGCKGGREAQLAFPLHQHFWVTSIPANGEAMGQNAEQ